MFSARLSRTAFTLAELLIALAILGVIATFTIPKVLQAQQDNAWNSAAKEALGMIASAYSLYSLNTPPNTNTKAADLTPFMNYVSVDTLNTTSIDSYQGATPTSWRCRSQEPCLTLHNGGKLLLRQYSFGGTSSSNAISFVFDPDGKVTDGTTDGPGKSIFIYMYFGGQLRTAGSALPNTTDSGGNYGGACSGCDPSWFSW